MKHVGFGITFFTMFLCVMILYISTAYWVASIVVMLAHMGGYIRGAWDWDPESPKND